VGDMRDKCRPPPPAVPRCYTRSRP
jgi:hypothetical protein